MNKKLKNILTYAGAGTIAAIIFAGSCLAIAKVGNYSLAKPQDYYDSVAYENLKQKYIFSNTDF